MFKKMRYAFIMILLLMITAPAARADMPGDLYVDAPPGISIFIDDEHQGVTNIDDKGLRLILLEGQYTLRAEIDGKVIFEKSFYLDSGGSMVITISP